MFAVKSNGGIAFTLVLAVVFWGGNNVAVKYLLREWPPLWLGCTRFLCAGALMLGLLRWTSWLGQLSPLAPEQKRALWWRGGGSLALYIIFFNIALYYIPVSHIALHLGASPVWALLWEGAPKRSWQSLQRYLAAGLALCGVMVLFLPSLEPGSFQWFGEVLGLITSILWTNYSRQSRTFSDKLSGVEITAHTMWRAGILMIPLLLVEVAQRGIPWRWEFVALQGYSVLFGGVAAFALWNNGLRHWPTSRVFLFNNLIPISTMIWANLCLKEPFTGTFLTAMLLIVTGVVIGQTNWAKLLDKRRRTAE